VSRDPLDPFSNADMTIGTTLKTFTVRELERSPASVLDAAEVDGAVLVRRRDGRVYRIQPEAPVRPRGAIPDFDARRRELGIPKLSSAITRKVDRWINGNH
jgi:hypothetical protein